MSHSKRNVIDEVKKNGFAVMPDFWSSEKCASVRSELDAIVIEKQQVLTVDKFGADHRVFGIEYISNLIKNEFYLNAQILSYFKSLYNVDNVSGTVLGQFVNPCAENQGSGGGWHRDSVPNQYKAFLFLSDVSVDAGPFQFYEGTHRLTEKIKSIVKLGWEYRRQLNYDSTEIIDKVVQSTKLVSLTCKAGTLAIVNTSAIHRGKPHIKVPRYSLTYYSFKSSMPPHLLAICDKAKSFAKHLDEV